MCLLNASNEFGSKAYSGCTQNLGCQIFSQLLLMFFFASICRDLCRYFFPVFPTSKPLVANWKRFFFTLCKIKSRPHTLMTYSCRGAIKVTRFFNRVFRWGTFARLFQTRSSLLLSLYFLFPLHVFLSLLSSCVVRAFAIWQNGLGLSDFHILCSQYLFHCQICSLTSWSHYRR